MGRKKKKHQAAPGEPSESSDECRARGCPHAGRAVDVGQLKRALRNGPCPDCQGCARSAAASSERPVGTRDVPEADVPGIAPACGSKVAAVPPDATFRAVEASLPESDGRPQASLPESATDAAAVPLPDFLDDDDTPMPPSGMERIKGADGVPSSDKVFDRDRSPPRDGPTDRRSETASRSVVCGPSVKSSTRARGEVAAVPPDGVTSSSFLICMRCGHVGCGSKGPHHALAHFSTPHSDPHCLALSLDTWKLWCYECGTSVDSGCRLDQAVQYVRKQAERRCAPAAAEPRVTRSVAKNGPKVREAQKDAEPAPSSRPPPRELRRVMGLPNLGNTCYFNSVVQCLGQTPRLEEILRERCRRGLRATFEPAEDSAEVGPLEVELPQAWPLTRALLQLLQEMRCGTPRPGPVFSQICNIAPQFRGNQQNDSHELLCHLLEGVRNEEAKRQKQAVLAAFGLSTKVDPGRVDAAVRRKIQAYKAAVSRTALDALFGGVLLSTVVCQECGLVLRREEPFKDLSLPIPDDKAVRLPKKVAEESGTRKNDQKTRRKNPDRKARARRNDRAPPCTLSGGSSQEPAEAEEADDEGVAAVAEECARTAPVVVAETLAPRPSQPQDGSLLACLHRLTAPELLAGANALLCEGCGRGVRSPASLQLLVQHPPQVLILHLKRFHQNGRSLCKVNRHIPFPLLLDLAPYCSPQKLERGPVPYALYAVVEHSGRLSGGHYTAYVKVRSDPSTGGRWYHASDSHVTEVGEETVLRGQAYLLFYERLR